MPVCCWTPPTNQEEPAFSGLLPANYAINNLWKSFHWLQKLYNYGKEKAPMSQRFLLTKNACQKNDMVQVIPAMIKEQKEG